MASAAKRTDPALWERVKAEVTAGGKGGEPGEWSARKAQMAVQAYKRAGGGYAGRKDPHNSLAEWTHEEWGTKSGAPSAETGERYLPKVALETLSDEEYQRTTAAKRRAKAKGEQFSAQPADIAAKAGHARRASHLDELSLADLKAQARDKKIAGYSRMRKAELVDALAG